MLKGVTTVLCNKGSNPASPGANVGEQFGDLGSVIPLANHSSWREMPDCEARAFARLCWVSGHAPFGMAYLAG